jgi:MFS family permease
VLYYSFSVFIRPIEAELGWSRTQVTGAFSLALLVAGLAAVPIGHWLDSRGARGLMTSGAVLASLLLLALSRTHSLAAFYAAWIGLGATMAMVLYEPAFAVIATSFARSRDRALTVLTVLGGLASTLIVPLASWLLERHGWRDALAALALLLACTTVPLHGLLLPPAPGRPAGAAPLVRLGPVLAEGRFRVLTAAFTLASLVSVATSVHLIPYLIGRGYSPAAAGAVLGLVGLMQLPGRLAFGAVRGLGSWRSNAAAVFLTQGVALVILGQTTHAVGVALFAGLFGLANGSSTLLRATVLADLYGADRFGRVSGVVSLFTTLGRGAGPVAASIAHAAWGGYAFTFGTLAALLGLAAILMVRPAADPRPGPSSGGGPRP